MTSTYFASTPHERAADNLRRAIKATGGLTTCAGLARRWGVSKTRAYQLTQMPDFPAPAAMLGRSPVYIVDECDRWRAERS